MMKIERPNILTVTRQFFRDLPGSWLRRDTSGSSTSGVLAALTHDGRRIKIPLLAVLLVTFAAVSLIVTLFLLALLRASLAEEFEHVIEGVERSIQNHVQYKADAMDHAMLSITENPSILTAFKARDEQALLKSTEQLFKRLEKDHRISHFYFVLPDRTTLLRIHQPDRKGDTIDRPSMLEASRTGKRASGIEMGPLGTFTLRVVKPWYDKGQLVGYLELGQEMDHLLNEMRPRSGTQFVWMVNKKLVDRTVWEERHANKGTRYHWNQFADEIVAATTLDRIPDELAKNTDLLISGKTGRLARINIAGTSSLYSVVPMDQWSQAGEGHLGVLVDTSDIEQMFRTTSLKVLGCILVVIVGSALLYYRVLGRVERMVVAALDHLEESVDLRTTELSETNKTLESEVAERKLTEMKLLQARREADEASRAKSEFVAGMSHELRTPLNAVLGFAQVLQVDANNPLSEKQNQRVGYILGAGNHLLELINEVLDLAKVEAGQLDFALETVDVNEVLADCVALTVPLARTRGIRIADEVSGGPSIELYADPLRFKQALINLLSNAVKYNKDQGEIVISGQPVERGAIRISISDTGIGIAEKDQHNVFQMFHRLGVQSGMAIEGTGIGLASTKALIEKMDGKIGFTSKEGVGSTFWIELPISSDMELSNDSAAKA